jgi:midasin (ATPase involved in ribosome maturation)
MTIYERRAAICQAIKQGRSPLPQGQTLTSIRQGASAAFCTEYMANHQSAFTGHQLPLESTPPTKPHTSEFMTNTPQPQPQNPTIDAQQAQALALLQAVQAVQAMSKPAAPAIDTEAVQALIDLAIAKASIAKASIATVTVVKRDDAPPVNVGAAHHKFSELVKIANDLTVKNIMLVGPSGSGKTHAAHQLATGLGLDYYSVGACILPTDLLGYVDATGVYRGTQFYEAFKNGGVLMLDEIDSYSERASLALNEALSNGSAVFGGQRVQRHPSLIVLAGANTWGNGATADFTGRARMDVSILGRFPVKMHWEIDMALEAAMAGDKAASTVQQLRERAKTAGIKLTLTPRHSVALRDLVSIGMTDDEAMELTCYAGLSAEEIKRLKG